MSAGLRSASREGLDREWLACTFGRQPSVTETAEAENTAAPPSTANSRLS